MAENERDEKPTLRPFYKEFQKGRKFGPNDIETGVHNFFWSTPTKTQGFCIFFRVPGNGKYALSCGKSYRNGRKRA